METARQTALMNSRRSWNCSGYWKEMDLQKSRKKWNPL